MPRPYTQTPGTSRGRPRTLIPGKVRAPRSFTMTPWTARLLKQTQRRLKLSRSDVLGLLITQYAAQLTRPKDTL